MSAVSQPASGAQSRGRATQRVVRRPPMRTCVGCRAERPKRELIRIVRAPDGSVALDPSGRAAGRGAYLCADGACWPVALKKSSIERALSAPLPAQLRGRLEQGESLLTGGTNGT